MRAVFFDLDQTLLDRTGSLLAFLKWQATGMLKPYLSNPAEFVSRFVELDNNGRVWKDEVYQHLIDEFEISDWEVGELLSIYENCFCAFCVPREGADQAVRSLAAGYQLGLITNGKCPFQVRNFRALGFSDAFDSVLVSEAVGLRKPDTKIFHLGCSELGVAPGEAVFIGDSPTADIGGARKAGLRTVFVPSDLHPACDIADETCEDMKMIPAIVGLLDQ